MKCSARISADFKKILQGINGGEPKTQWPTSHLTEGGGAMGRLLLPHTFSSVGVDGAHVHVENKTKREHPSVVHNRGPNGGGHGEKRALLMK